MLKQPFYIGFNLFQNANVSAESVKADFLVRKYEYSAIHSDLLRYPKDRSVQHYLLLGKRGSGKSTLLHRLQVEIDTDEQLTANYIAVNLAEEQANIYRLFDLLEEIVSELQSREYEFETIEADLDEHLYCRQLFYLIHRTLEKADKKLVLLLDNLDRIFENIGEDASLLRENLENFGDIKIIGASTRMTEHFWAYNKPFYEFFRVLELAPLKKEEVKEMLLHWGEKLQINELKDFVANKPGQLETIRVLTDGLPRTLQFFVDILLTSNKETGYEYLKLLMDKITPLYQERLNSLPPSQRKIVLQLAFLWEAVGAKEIAQATHMETRVISAQLNQLVNKKVAEKIETKTKNHLYRLSERFFNLWLIFTQGSPYEKRRARYLSIFLENFYDENELMALALSLPDISPSLKMELPQTIVSIIEKVYLMADKKQWDRAIELINTIEQQDGVREFLSSRIHIMRSEFEEAKNLLLGLELKGFPLVNIYLGLSYHRLGDWENAEKYYRIAFENREYGSDSVNMLSRFYYRSNQKKAEALALLKEFGTGSSSLSLIPVVKAWNGEFIDLKEMVSQLIMEDNPYVEFTLTHLLIHYQENLVMQMFASSEFGGLLIEKFLPLHYAAILLSPEGEELLNKIPPELKEAVHAMLISTFAERNFYYGANEVVDYPAIRWLIDNAG
jgi:hypothetical protein